ncbi:YkgJ family cysteine cluster protein [Thermodesulfobacteriota bacterium]
MDIPGRKERLAAIYADYAQQAQQYKTGAACKIGCAFCCTHFGNVDVITFEGLVIHEWINGLEKPAQRRIRKKIVKNMKKKEKGIIARCPFLASDSTCQIYPVRPFSCRQLYSMKECNEKGPTVHRQAVALAKKTVKHLQQMDRNGYSGHISFILHLHDRSDFRKLYQSGGFNPAEIASFGKEHGIIINRVVSAS